MSNTITYTSPTGAIWTTATKNDPAVSYGKVGNTGESSFPSEIHSEIAKSFTLPDYDPSEIYGEITQSLSPYAYASPDVVITKETMNTQSKPQKQSKRAPVEMESALLKYINKSVMPVQNSYVALVHGLLNLNDKIISDMRNSNQLGTKHFIYQLYKYDYAPTSTDGMVKNIIIADGILEFIPNAMAQALMLRSLLSNLFQDKRGYVVVRHYDDDYLKSHAGELKLEPKGNGYLMPTPKGTKIFVRGLNQNDVLNILGFGRIDDYTKINITGEPPVIFVSVQ